MFGSHQDRPVPPEERALARLERQRLEIVTKEEITSDEGQWLAERIGQDGRLTPNETALLTCIKNASPKIAPELQVILDKLEDAA